MFSSSRQERTLLCRQDVLLVPQGLAWPARTPCRWLAVSVEDEEVGRWHALTVGEVNQVGDGAVIDGSEDGQQVGGGPTARRLGAVARPVLVLRQVRRCHAGEPTGIHADAPAECVDPVS